MTKTRPCSWCGKDRPASAYLKRGPNRDICDKCRAQHFKDWRERCIELVEARGNGDE